MKENRKSLYSGYEILRVNPNSVSTMRKYWKGSPWRAIGDLLRR